MALQPFILHAHASSPNPIKVAVALEYLKLPYEVKIWEFGDDPEHGVKGTSMARLTPNGRVPVLQDPNTGVTVWESGAIINYLKRQYDQGNVLGPKDDSLQSRADVEIWEHLLVTTIAPLTGQFTWFTYYEPTPNPSARARYEGQVRNYYKVLEGQLAKSGGKSILPSGITSADVHCEPWIRRPEFVGIPLDEYPNIQSWLKNMAEQKAFQDGYQRIRDVTHRNDPYSQDRGVTTKA